MKVKNVDGKRYCKTFLIGLVIGICIGLIGALLVRILRLPSVVGWVIFGGVALTVAFGLSIETYLDDIM